MFGYIPRSRAETLRLALLLPACVGILSMEYRLMVPSLVSSILSMLFIAAASAIKKLAAKHYPGDAASRSMNASWLVVMGYIIIVVSAAIGWPTEEWEAFDMGSLLPRIVNAVSTAAALLMGGSMFFPTNAGSEHQLCRALYVPTERIRDVLQMLALTGVIGCSSTLLLRRSYTSWWQLSFFILAVMCLCGKEVYDSIWNRSKLQNDNGGSYNLVSQSPKRRSEDSEESGFSESRTSQTESRGYSRRSSLVSVALIMLWTAFVNFNFGQRQYPQTDTLLDRAYQATVPLEIVVSMYKEKTDDVATLISKLQSMPQISGAHVTIYLKDGEADEEQIRQETNSDEVIKLPNVGREAETYLNHILNRWDSLAERTIFLQADVHNPREFYPFVERYFSRNQTGFLNLGWAGNVCNGEDCGDKFGWHDETSFVPYLQNRIDTSPSENVLLSYKGQFVVTAVRIRGIDKAIYNDLEQLLVDEKSWTHQQEYLQGRKDSMSQPFFGYTMERIWNVLFQCSDMDVAWKCPSLLSGWRPGGSIADCQCFDDEGKSSWMD
jgi:hypothetical protein